MPFRATWASPLPELFVPTLFTVRRWGQTVQCRCRMAGVHSSMWISRRGFHVHIQIGTEANSRIWLMDPFLVNLACCGTFPADASSRARIPLSEAGLPPAAAHSLDISRISPGKSCVSLDTRLPRDVVNPCPNAAYSSPAAANTVTPPVAIATIAFRS